MILPNGKMFDASQSVYVLFEWKSVIHVITGQLVDVCPLKVIQSSLMGFPSIQLLLSL